MEKIYIIAGNKQQANEWMLKDIDKRIKKNTEVTLSHYVYVNDFMTLKGVKNPHGVCVGTWKDRKDIKEIAMELVIATENSKKLPEEILNLARNGGTIISNSY